MRQIVVDTETTGLEVENGHRIIEVGCVEIVDRRLTRRHFHHYINPDRDIDEGAFQVHGISKKFLADKPAFDAVWPDFLKFVEGAELIIHNAAFDVAFIDQEIRLMSKKPGSITDYCEIVDSLALARSKHPGQKNTLDALCKRYNVDNSGRELHGALLDAEILADVYLLLTGGQVTLGLGDTEETDNRGGGLRRLSADRPRLNVIAANDDEMAQHERKLDKIEETTGEKSVWRKLESVTE